MFTYYGLNRIFFRIEWRTSRKRVLHDLRDMYEQMTVTYVDGKDKKKKINK